MRPDVAGPRAEAPHVKTFSYQTHSKILHVSDVALRVVRQRHRHLTQCGELGAVGLRWQPGASRDGPLRAWQGRKGRPPEAAARAWAARPHLFPLREGLLMLLIEVGTRRVPARRAWHADGWVPVRARAVAWAAWRGQHTARR